MNNHGSHWIRLDLTTISGVRVDLGTTLSELACFAKF